MELRQRKAFFNIPFADMSQYEALKKEDWSADRFLSELKEATAHKRRSEKAQKQRIEEDDSTKAGEVKSPIIEDDKKERDVDADMRENEKVERTLAVADKGKGIEEDEEAKAEEVPRWIIEETEKARVLEADEKQRIEDVEKPKAQQAETHETEEAERVKVLEDEIQRYKTTTKKKSHGG